MLTCLIGNEIINCYDGTHEKETLKNWSKKKILICPACGKPYEYYHGKVKIPYFRHMDKLECEDKYFEQETQEHIKGKKDLYEWIKKQNDIKNPILEAWIPETKQRPDIMFEYNGKRYVIEYQCSPISSQYIERHELYQAIGINDIWICGTEKYLKDNMRNKFLESKAIGFYDAEKMNFISISNSKQYRVMKKINCKYQHSKNIYFGLKLNNFSFNGDIYNILYGDVKIAKEKQLLRAKNKTILETKSGKYLRLQKDKLLNELSNNLHDLSNDNWKFYILKRKNKYKTVEYIHVKPTIVFNMLYYKQEYFGVKKFSKICLTDNFELLKRCAKDIEFLKAILLKNMKYNKECMLTHASENERILEVNYE